MYGCLQSEETNSPGQQGSPLSVMPHSQGSPLGLTQHVFCEEPISDSNVSTSTAHAADDTWPDESQDLDVSTYFYVLFYNVLN